MAETTEQSLGVVAAKSTTGANPQAEAGEDAFNTGTVLTIAAAHAVHDTYTAFLPPLLPKLIQDLLLTKTEASLLTVFSQGASLLQPFIGHAADRLDLKYLVMLAPAITAAAMTLLGVSSDYGVLVLLLLVSSISSAGLHAVGPAIAGVASGRSLGRAMGFWMVGGELGRTLGPLVLVTALRFLTGPQLPWLMIGGVLSSGVLYYQLRSVNGSLRQSRGKVSASFLQGIGRMRSFLVPLIGILIARAFLVNATTTFLPTYLTESGHDLWFAGVSLSVLEAAGVAGALAGGSVSDRLGRRRTLFISMLVAPILVLIFLISPTWLHFPLLVLMGLSVLSVAPVMMALVQETYPDSRALANGLYMFLNFGTRSVVAVLLGLMSDLLGMRMAFALCAAAALFGLPLLRYLPRRKATEAGA